MVDTEMQHKTSIETSPECPDMKELTERFGPKKSDSLMLSQIYADLGETSRALRVADCGTFLEFAHDFIYETGEFSPTGRLHHANFCRDLLCPMCSWRKSLKQISQLSLALNHESINGKYKAIMVTLTIPNVAYNDLKNGIDKCLKSFDRLLHRKKYKKLFKGFFRSLEITINEKTGTFHPHLHILVLVPLSYGYCKDSYISHDELLNDWRQATRDQSITQVDIRLAYSKKLQDPADYTLNTAALEAAKYAAKIPRRYYKPEIIAALLSGLSHRRTYSYGGVLKDAFETLGLEELEEADLVHINDSVPEPVMQMIIRYGWTPSGYQIINTRMEGGNADECCEVC